MEIVQAILTRNPCYKLGKKISVKGIALHSIGCPQPSAKVLIHNWNRDSCDNKCAHAFIDANDGTVYQTLPWNHKGRHCGRHPVTKQSGNDSYIGIEMCEPYQLKYKKEFKFTLDGEEEKNAAIECVKRMYASAVELCVQLCTEFNLDPLRDIVSHKEAYEQGFASNKGDPEHLWQILGLPYSMDSFRTDVKTQMVEQGALVDKDTKEENLISNQETEEVETESIAENKEVIIESADDREETPKEIKIRVDVENLRIRSGPGTNYDPIGKYTGIGQFIITEIQNGNGSSAGWGKLKTVDGWVCLDYVVILEG